MQDDIDLYTYVNSRALATNERIGNESQVLTNQIWKGRVEDLQEKSAMYVDIVSRDNAQNLRLCDELYKRREQDVHNKYLMNCLLLFLLRDIVHIQYLMLE